MQSSQNQDKRLYEINYLLALKSREKVAEIASKIREYIEKKKGELIEVEKEESPESRGGKSFVWVDQKRLAYPIGNDKAGYYLVSWFKMGPAEIEGIKRFLKLDKDIVRYEILVDRNIARQKPTRESVRIEDMDKLSQEPAGRMLPPKPRIEKIYEKAVVEKEVKVEKETIAEKAPEEKKEAPKTVVKAKKAPLETAQELAKPVAVEEKEVTAIETPEVEKKIVEKPVLEKEVALPEIELEPEKPKESEKPVEKEKVAEKKDEKLKKPKKISLEDLDKRLDDILNEEIL